MKYVLRLTREADALLQHLVVRAPELEHLVVRHRRHQDVRRDLPFVAQAIVHHVDEPVEQAGDRGEHRGHAQDDHREQAPCLALPDARRATPAAMPAASKTAGITQNQRAPMTRRRN